MYLCGANTDVFERYSFIVVANNKHVLPIFSTQYRQYAKYPHETVVQKTILKFG